MHCRIICLRTYVVMYNKFLVVYVRRINVDVAKFKFRKHVLILQFFSEIREITSNITRATQVQTVRTESLRFRPNVNTLTANGIPTGGNPHIFQLISEMNSTIHHSPWQESEVVAQL